MAYVRISTEHLRQINVTQQLRIYSAGVWHNLVLAAFALALVSANPFLLKPLYHQGSGVTVIDVKQGSGLGQKGGLMKEDAIIGVNECLVRTQTDFRDCIRQEYVQDQSGFCADEAFYKKEDISITKNGTSDCCPKTSQHMCFRIAQNESKEIVVQPGTYLSIKENLGHMMCLPVRKLAENALMCWEDTDCYQELCLLPILDSQSERFLRIRLSSQRTVFYVGQIEEIFSSVAVSPWVSEYASVCYIDMYELLIGYIFSFSCGLAILNTIPLFWLDGNYVIECIIHGYLRSYISKVVYRRMFVFALKMIGCVGLLLFIFIALLKYV